MEQEDETLRSHARDEEDEESPNPVDVEAKPAEVQSEEDEMGLGVRRRTSCQRSRSSGESSNSCPPLWVRHSHREKLPTRSPRTSGEGKQERARTYQKATRGTSRKKVSLWCSVCFVLFF